MTLNVNKMRRIWELCAPAAILLPVCFIYCWRTLQTHLIYAAFGDFIDFPIFVPGRAFLVESLASPGGPVKYVSDFLSQGFHHDAVGALVITGVAFGYYLVALILLQLVAGIRSHVISAAGAVGVVALYGDYGHYLPALLSVLAPAAMSAAFVACRPRSHFARLVLFLAAFVFVYWAAGAASLLFAVIVALGELLRGRWLISLTMLAVAAISAYLIGTLLFTLEWPLPFMVGLPIFPIWTGLGSLSIKHLCLFFPASILIAVLVKMPSHMPSKHGASKKGPKASSAAGVRRHRKDRRRKEQLPAGLTSIVIRPWLKTAIAILVIGPAAVFVIARTHDLDRKRVLHMTDLMQKRQWDAYLEVAKDYHRRGLYNLQINHDINRALYHAGRLCDEMFSFEQRGPALMILTAEPLRFSSKFIRVSDLFFEMGNVNDAEHWAYEILETEGPSPRILARLVDINLAKEQSAAAAVFLNTLSRDLVHGSSARQRLRQIKSDPHFESDPRILHARSFRWRNNRVLNYDNVEDLLLRLLEEHPHNRMAFEYLMAFYLLSHKQERIVANLHRLDDLGYDRIPRHIEEAIMVYVDNTRRPVNLRGRQISQETIQLRGRYLQLYEKAGRNKDAAMPILAPEFGNSYLFYCMYTCSGVGR